MGSYRYGLACCETKTRMANKISRRSIMGYNWCYNGYEFNLGMGISLYRNRCMGIYEVEE